MAISQLTLYKNCKIVPERRIKVERLEDYLAGLQNIYINNFQYIKHSLNLEIKIDRNQTGLLIKQSENYNYIKIRNVITPVDYDDYYYFIISKKWIAQDTLKLVLKMDTINTFYDKMSFNAKTQILREHKVSHVKSGQSIYPVLDFNSEGLFPQLYNSKSGYYSNKKIIEKLNYNIDWYLVYYNVNAPTPEDLQNPVQFFLATSSEVTIPAYQGIIKPLLFDEDYNCLTFSYGDNGMCTIKCYYYKNGNLLNENYVLNSIVYSDNSHRIRLKSISFDYSQNPLQVILCGYDLDADNTLVSWLRWPEANNTLTWEKADTDCMYARNFDDYQYILNYYQYCESEKYLVRFSNGYGGFTTFNIAGVDRTDSRVIKIIKIPYCPENFLHTYSTLSNQFRVMYEGGGMIRGLTNGLTSFSNNFTPLDESGNAIEPFEFLKPMNYQPQYWEQYSVDDEPKMFHSEFFCVKLVYDSFVLNLPAEALGVDGSVSAIADDFSITFKMTSTINSRFMWKVNNYITKYGSENFDNALCVARNNELPIYTSAYLNYIRTGYNYDLKAKTTREVSTWAGFGLSILGGAVAGAKFGGEAGAVAGAVVGAVGGLIGAITSTIQAENTFNRNLQSLEWQTNSVRDSNDVDLMTEYCGNRLQVFYYIASPKVRQQVERLFYYYGYKSERVGLPNPNIRIGWDFLQCQAEFNKNEWNVPEEYIMDLKTQLEAGTTFIHYIAEANQEDNSHWDIDQQYANYEKSIM